MIVDTSALLAVLCGEPEADRYLEVLVEAPALTVSAATLVETAAVVDAAGDPVLSRRLDELLSAARVDIAPFTVAQANIARQAYRDFGKGAGTPRDSTSVTASPTPSPGTPTSRCLPMATTSRTRKSARPSD